jgi:pimeloyl-ACP methyl ester carboxylesterase
MNMSDKLLFQRQILVIMILLFQAKFSFLNAWSPGTTFFPSQPVQQLVVPKNARILILPGFGNDSSDYFLEQAPQGSLVTSLVRRGWDIQQICVLPIQRVDWLQVFSKGMFDYKFWQGTAPPTRPAFQWYINRIAECVNDLSTTTTTTKDNNNDNDGSYNNNDDDVKIILIGHSAGGWLARAALGYGSIGDEENKFDTCIDLTKICGLVTLGAPHFPPPPDKMDMTRGALTLTSSNFPGAYHEEIFYVTVIGDAVQGMMQSKKNPFEPTNETGFAYNSYEAVCGDGEVIGDGVVPVVAGHLDGAIQLNLNGIFHSMNVPELWYGSDFVIDAWHQVMLKEFHQKCETRKPQLALKNPFGVFFQ